MGTEHDSRDFAPIEVPKIRRGPWGALKIALAAAVVMGLAWAWSSDYRPSFLRARLISNLRFVSVDRGTVDLFVVENGTVESANNTTVRCEVEALMGLVGGSQTGAKGKTASASASSEGGSSSSSASTSSAKTSTTSKTTTTKTGATSTTGSTSTSKTSGTSTASSSGSSTSSSSASSSGSSTTSSSGSSGSSSSTASSGGTTAGSKPTLRSFTTTVAAYVPMRPTATASASTTTKQSGQSNQSGGQGRGGQMSQEKPGSTRIVTILPEGTRVKANDVVVELDKSAFEDEEKNQLVRYLSAKSYVDQAASTLAVAEISLREYRDGILPQDEQLVHHYIEICENENERATNNATWARDMYGLNYLTDSQMNSYQLTMQQAGIALAEARGMLDRLVKYTGPKLVKELEANVAAIKADKLTQERSFNLEKQRLERIQKNIAHCTVRAPSDGIVIYANQANPWGRVESVIDQGVTLRENQEIFKLPDPRHMRVKSQINESKIALVQPGKPVLITVDAFPEHPLRGRVAGVTPISIPLRGSDVRVYYANIDIIEGFDSLKTGLSAEIAIQVESKHDVVRVPIDAIRWVGDRSFVALRGEALDPHGRPTWQWREVQLGLSDPDHAEIQKGVEPGDQVVDNPNDLPAPVLGRDETPAPRVASHS